MKEVKGTLVGKDDNFGHTYSPNKPDILSSKIFSIPRERSITLDILETNLRETYTFSGQIDIEIFENLKEGGMDANLF